MCNHCSAAVEQAYNVPVVQTWRLRAGSRSVRMFTVEAWRLPNSEKM